MIESDAESVPPGSDAGQDDMHLPGRGQKFVEYLVTIRGRFRHNDPHLWVIVGLLMVCTLVYYAEQILAATNLSLQIGFFQTVHDLHRTLFLIPLIYSAITYRLWGSLYGSAFFLAVILPRALLYSTMPDPLLRPIIFFFLASALSILVAVQLNYIEYHIKTKGNLLKLREEVATLTAARDNLIKFFNMAAHDMKSPLAAVQNYFNTMLAGYTGELNDKQKQWLERSKVRIEELSELITDLLDISRIKNSTIINEMKMFSLKGEIERCVSDAQQMAASKGIKLTIDIEDSLPEIFGSDTHIRRVLTNLIDNAVKYTPENGEVKVRASRQPGSVLVEVIDNGIGIPPDELPQVFHDFYRASNAKNLKGTGLGLSIVREILEIHGGKIRAESPAPGLDKGCRFSFILPVKVGQN
jgi:signal transduction histidine kinase